MTLRAIVLTPTANAMIVQLLREGMSVVLDFQANTVDSRAWMRGLLDQTNADHQFHVLMPPDDICLARLQIRNARGQHLMKASI